MDEEYLSQFFNSILEDEEEKKIIQLVLLNLDEEHIVREILNIHK